MSRYVASNSAGVKFDFVHFLKADGKDLIILAVGVLVGGIVAAFNWKFGLGIMGFSAFVPLNSLFSTPQIFRDGDVCPAVVIDPDRQLVAVFTNLSKGGRPKPVVKVLKQPLKRAVKKPVKKGTRLAFVAMYNGFASSPNWLDFGGYLVDTGTRNSKVIQRVLSSISETDWENVIAAVNGLDKPFSEGLFDVQVGKRSRGEGGVKSVRHNHLRKSLKIAAYVVAGLVALPIVVGVLKGKMRFAGAAGAPNPGGGMNNPAPVPLAAAQPNPVVVNPGFPPRADGWTPPTNPVAPPPHIDPAEIMRNMRPAGAPDTTSIPGANPFRPKAPDAEESPFRPKAAEADENPFRLKTPQSQTANNDSGKQAPVANSASGGTWRVGDKAEGLDHTIWRPATILEVRGDGWKIHWDGWSDQWDEVLPGNRLRPAQGAK